MLVATLSKLIQIFVSEVCITLLPLSFSTKPIESLDLVSAAQLYLKKCITRNMLIFVWNIIVSKFDIGYANVAQRKIKKKSEGPIHLRQFLIPLEQRQNIHDWVDKLLAKGVTSGSNVFSTIDLTCGFLQKGLASESCKCYRLLSILWV